MFQFDPVSDGFQFDPCFQIKLVLDAHAATIVVVRMVEGAKPQPPQTFTPSVFLTWVKTQCGLAKEVVSCYEAGPTGFWSTGNGPFQWLFRLSATPRRETQGG